VLRLLVEDKRLGGGVPLARAAIYADATMSVLHTTEKAIVMRYGMSVRCFCLHSISAALRLLLKLLSAPTKPCYAADHLENFESSFIQQ